MPVTGLNHVNIRTTDVERSARFYVDLFDFEFRKGAPVMGHTPNWLYDAAGRPIIHFRIQEPDSPSTGPIDHVALNCQGKTEILERLKARDIQHSVTDTAPGVTLIFVKDPHGVSLELNFVGE